MHMHFFSISLPKKNLKDIQEFRISQCHKGEKDLERLEVPVDLQGLKHKGQDSERQDVAYCLKADTLKEDPVGSGTS